jgi:hypothetical protein
VPASEGLRVRRKIDGGYQISAADAVVIVNRNNRDPAQANSSQAPSLAGFDADNNGYLDENEAKNVPQIGAAFASADSDADGKLFPAELKEFVDRQNRASAVRLVLSVADFGQDLFKLADDDGDGVLVPRELKRLGHLAESEDKDGDRLLGGSEIPQQFALELARGEAADEPAMGGRARSRAAAARSAAGGPSWFRKMDRNSDGDLSRAEFLGPADVFDKLDGDADGLVSDEEAEAAKAK